MIWVILGLLFVFILFISGQYGLPDEEENEIRLYFDEKDELLEDEILLYFDEEDLFDDDDERARAVAYARYECMHYISKIKPHIRDCLI